MYKDSATDKCTFCSKNTYSNGTLPTCLSCSNDLSLITGIYYKIWNELPTYLTRNYISFEETSLRMFVHCSLACARIASIFQWHKAPTVAVGWVKDLFVSSWEVMRTDLDSKHPLHILPGNAGCSVSLELNYRPRFSSYRSNEDHPTVWNIEFQVLSPMSIHLCPDSSLSGRPFHSNISLWHTAGVFQDTYNDDFDEWDVIHKWRLNQTLTHQHITEYTSVKGLRWRGLIRTCLSLGLIRYPVIHPNPVMFSWLFATDSDEQGGDEIRIYEIRVTNTVSGGSDRCVRCLTMDNQETE